MNRDLVFGLATLAIASAYYALTATIPPSELADPIGPQGLPRMYSIVLAALSIVLVIRSLRTRTNREPSTIEPRTAEPRTTEPSNHRSPVGTFRVAGMLLIGIAYILVLPYLGYLVSVAMLIAVTSYLQGGALNGRTVLVALSGAALFWAVFIWLLRIQYPAGLWPSLI
jgi:putative tricarboxylic transport membrane protein